MSIVTKHPAGRMLGGTGSFLGPSPNTQFDTVVEFLKAHLPQFAEIVLHTDIMNENGLNSRLSRFITNTAAQEIFFAERESMEDETYGNSPAGDIGIYLNVMDIGIDPPLITIFEGKRLTTKLPNKRRREYVIGHEEDGKHVTCGGIERFKLAIHGGRLKHAGMIGYLQDGTPDIWQAKVNTWICDLCNQPSDPAWSEREKLMSQKNDERIAEYSSIANRKGSTLHLTHLWINLVE